MQTENEKAILDAVAGCPGASAGDIARHLGMDRSNVRRDAKKLERDGKLIKQNDGGTFRFYLAEPAQSYAPRVASRPHQNLSTEFIRM
jgi:DNA-binding MarR family transcriptional regulator